MVKEQLVQGDLIINYLILMEKKMLIKHTVLALSLLVASQASSMSWFNRTFRPEYSDLSDTLERCPVGEKKCLDYFAKYKKEINKENRYKRGETSFSAAVRTRSLPEVKHLVSLGADVNAIVNGNEISAPIWSAFYRFVDIWNQENGDEGREFIKYLVSNGADIEGHRSKDTYWKTPLMESSNNYYQDSKMTQWLIENGANVNPACGSPLMASFNNLEKTKLLLKAGANVNFSDFDKSTPLHEAVKFCNRDIAKELVKHGADIYAADNDGRTPLSIALKKNDFVTAAALVAYSQKPLQSQMTEFTGPNFIDN